jgi:hypothetical protein
LGDFHGTVLIEAMKANQGIKQKKPGLECLERCAQTLLVISKIEAQHFGGNGVEWDLVDIEVAVPAQGLDSGADCRQGIFGQVDQNRADLLNGETVQAGRPRSHTQGHIQAQPGFATLWRAANDTHGLPGPE